MSKSCARWRHHGQTFAKKQGTTNQISRSIIKQAKEHYLCYGKIASSLLEWLHSHSPKSQNKWSKILTPYPPQRLPNPGFLSVHLQEILLHLLNKTKAKKDALKCLTFDNPRKMKFNVFFEHFIPSAARHFRNIAMWQKCEVTGPTVHSRYAMHTKTSVKTELTKTRLQIKNLMFYTNPN